MKLIQASVDKDLNDNSSVDQKKGHQNEAPPKVVREEQECNENQEMPTFHVILRRRSQSTVNLGVRIDLQYDDRSHNRKELLSDTETDSDNASES